MSAPTPESTPWLTEAQQEVWRFYLGGTTLLSDRLDRDLREQHDLSIFEYEILVRLSEAPERTVRMAHLAAALSHSRSRITHTIARLEADGYVARGQSRIDGRGVTAVLTDQGYAALEAAAHTHVRGVSEHLVQHASDEEFAVLGRVMKRVVDDLDPTGVHAR